jgi:CDP-glycerol glycerophosphotransferase
VSDTYKVKIVQWNSLAYIYYNITSKIYITNSDIGSYIPFRKVQIVINTWHGGGAFKRTGIVDTEKKYKVYQKFILESMARKTTYFISSSRVFSERKNLYYYINPNKFLPIGMPRNDILFYPHDDISKRVKDVLGINQADRIILYSPTFRGSTRNATLIFNMDINRVMIALAKRFDGKFVFLYRMHHTISSMLNIENGIDVSAYADMQELLCASDVMISDYSSAMWDFSLTYKPCFIYAPDIPDYGAERGFASPIEEWPFPIAETNDELEQNILLFSSKHYMEKVKEYHASFGSYEQGTATEQITKLIVKSVEKQ